MSCTLRRMLRPPRQPSLIQLSHLCSNSPGPRPQRLLYDDKGMQHIPFKHSPWHASLTSPLACSHACSQQKTAVFYATSRCSTTTVPDQPQRYRQYHLHSPAEDSFKEANSTTRAERYERRSYQITRRAVRSGDLRCSESDVRHDDISKEASMACIGHRLG